ncbi:alpha/beta fold hydrolase [Thiotrichales bacterium 19X7-9]|nr:alpha/beta fold hydrolase [Thiotrichales bacterium 19X7-9]
MFDWQKLINEHDNLQKKLSKLPQKLNSKAKSYHINHYDVIFENHLFKLRYYCGNSQKTNQIALCVYSLVNTVDILDFSDDVSFVDSLKKNYCALYVIEWKQALDEPIFHSLENYIIQSLNLAIDIILDQAKKNQIDLFGICQGGVFALVYTAIYPNKINRLILLMTPIDHKFLYQQALLLEFYTLASNNNKSKIISKESVKHYFASLRPLKHYLGRNVDIALAPYQKRKQLLAIDSWLNQPMPLSISVFKEYYHKIIKENRLVLGGLTIGEHKVNLSNINCPVINVYANYDQLVPLESSNDLALYIKSSYYEISLNAGHIGIFIQKRYLNQFIKKYENILDSFS